MDHFVDHPPGHRPWKSPRGRGLPHPGACKFARTLGRNIRRVFRPDEGLDDGKISFDDLAIQPGQSRAWNTDIALRNGSQDRVEHRARARNFSATASTARLEHLLATVATAKFDVADRREAEAPDITAPDFLSLGDQHSDSCSTASIYEIKQHGDSRAGLSKRNSLQSAMSVSNLLRGLGHTPVAQQWARQPILEIEPSHQARCDSAASSSVAPSPGVPRFSGSRPGKTSTHFTDGQMQSVISAEAFASRDRSGAHMTSPPMTPLEAWTLYQTPLPLRNTRQYCFDNQRASVNPKPPAKRSASAKRLSSHTRASKSTARRAVQRAHNRQPLDYRPQKYTETAVHRNCAAPTVRHLLAPRPHFEEPKASIPIQRSSDGAGETPAVGAKAPCILHRAYNRRRALVNQTANISEQQPSLVRRPQNIAPAVRDSERLAAGDVVVAPTRAHTRGSAIPQPVRHQEVAESRKHKSSGAPCHYIPYVTNMPVTPAVASPSYEAAGLGNKAVTLAGKAQSAVAKGVKRPITTCPADRSPELQTWRVKAPATALDGFYRF